MSTTGIFTNLTEQQYDLHGIFESSRLESTDVGRIYDALVVKEETVSGQAVKTPIAVDNGVAIKIGEFTGNGLQEVYATIAAKKDKIAVTGAPALVKVAFTKAQESPLNYFNPAGKDTKSYQLKKEYADIFGIGLHQFKDASTVKVGAYVTWDGTQWEATTAAPADATYGFIGKVHSLGEGTYYTTVRVLTLKNEQLA